MCACGIDLVVDSMPCRYGGGWLEDKEDIARLLLAEEDKAVPAGESATAMLNDEARVAAYAEQAECAALSIADSMLALTGYTMRLCAAGVRSAGRRFHCSGCASPWATANSSAAAAPVLGASATRSAGTNGPKRARATGAGSSQAAIFKIRPDRSFLLCAGPLRGQMVGRMSFTIQSLARKGT